MGPSGGKIGTIEQESCPALCALSFSSQFGKSPKRCHNIYSLTVTSAIEFTSLWRPIIKNTRSIIIRFCQLPPDVQNRSCNTRVHQEIDQKPTVTEKWRYHWCQLNPNYDINSIFAQCVTANSEKRKNLIILTIKKWTQQSIQQVIVTNSQQQAVTITGLATQNHCTMVRSLAESPMPIESVVVTSPQHLLSCCLDDVVMPYSCPVS